jgi:hypothetical protein
MALLVTAKQTIETVRLWGRNAQKKGAHAVWSMGWYCYQTPYRENGGGTDIKESTLNGQGHAQRQLTGGMRVLNFACVIK